MMITVVRREYTGSVGNIKSLVSLQSGEGQ
jgi:hypothetical protein